MVARLFGPGLFLRGGMRLRNCGRHWYLLQLLDEPFCPPRETISFATRRTWVFDVRRERDANTDLCRYVSYGQTAKYSLRADIFRSSTENGHPRQAFAFAKLDNGEAYR